MTQDHNGARLRRRDQDDSDERPCSPHTPPLVLVVGRDRQSLRSTRRGHFGALQRRAGTNGRASSVPLDWVAKTLANHKSNAKAALIWFCKEKDHLAHGVPLSPTWDRLRARLKDPSTRYRLTPLMRFCSGLHIEPQAVNEAIIDRFMEHRARTTARSSAPADRRILARLWNGATGKIEGWPENPLVEPPVKAADGPTWADFPETLRSDIEGYLNSLTRIRRDKAGHRTPPCKASTITARKRELVAALRMALKVGVPLEKLTSLRALIHPDIAEQILDGYWKKDGDEPKTYTINLSCRFLGLARAVGGLEPAALQRLSIGRALGRDERVRITCATG